jgi:hypothetical protein
MSMSMIRSTTVAVLALGLAAAAPASATRAPGKSREAWFRVSVEGVQTLRWTENHPSRGGCDYDEHGSGTERVVFRSRRSVLVHAFQLFGIGPVMFAGPSDQADLPMRGTVHRQGTLTLAPPAPGCAVGDGGDGSYTPPASDCGTKRITRLALRLEYDALNPRRITLWNDGNEAAPEFTNCPAQGDAWTTILSRDDHRRTAGEELPAHDLFDRRQGKILVLGRGKVHSSSSGVEATTRIRWTLTLRRVRR